MDAPPPAVELEGVWAAYGTQAVLIDVHLRIEPGDFACVIGPNGGGKSTLLKVMLGLVRPTRGAVRIFGRPPATMRPHIGYVPQDPALDPDFPITVEQVVQTGRLGVEPPLGALSRKGRQACLRAMQAMQCAELRRRRFGQLSAGQRQRVLIARALACEPKLLLLDEPTSGLDVEAERRLYELLAELTGRLTIVMVTHDVGWVSRFVRTAVCVHHRVHVHPPGELTAEAIRDLFGRQVRLVTHAPPADAQPTGDDPP